MLANITVILLTNHSFTVSICKHNVQRIRKEFDSVSFNNSKRLASGAHKHIHGINTDEEAAAKEAQGTE